MIPGSYALKMVIKGKNFSAITKDLLLNRNPPHAD